MTTPARDDREAFNAQYETARQLPDGNVGAYFSAFDAASAAARREFDFEVDVRYGEGERETFDFVAPRAAGAPLVIWIHGGYWRRMSKDAFSFVAGPVVRAGYAAALLNYPLAPGHDLDRIVDAVARGFRAACAHARPARTIVCGHSVGAQLAATVAARHPIAGMLALSGLYDLEPLRHSSINDAIAMDEATARRNGPIHIPPLAPIPRLVVAVGGREQTAFAEQQRRYVEAWRAWGGDATVVDAPEHDHFSIVLELARDDAPITRALLALLA